MAAHSRSLLSLLISAGLFAACGGDDNSGSAKLVTVESAISPDTIAAGSQATVSCVAYDKNGQPVATELSVEQVSGPSTATIDGFTVSATALGEYAFTCVHSSGLRDETPAKLTVIASTPTRIEAKLDPSTIQAGGDATIDCVAYDANNNPVPTEFRYSAIPTQSSTINGNSITATEVGTYSVTCASGDLTGSATLTVTPGDIASLKLSTAINAPSFATMQLIVVTAQGLDAYGNAIEGNIPFENLDASPTGSHEVVGQGDRLRFRNEGKYTLSAHAVGKPNVRGELPIVIDKTAPSIELTSPERGLIEKENDKVLFTGRVTDNLGEIASFVIGSTQVDVAADGSFSVELPLKYGLSLFDVTAADPYGNTKSLTRSVERSSHYYPMADRTINQSGVNNALALVLAQDTFDDNDTTEASVDDLAHLFQLVLTNIDLTSLAPNPLTSFNCIQGQCKLIFEDFTIEDVTPDLTLRTDELWTDITLHNASATLTLQYPCNVPFLCPSTPVASLPVTITFETIRLTGAVFFSVQNGEIVIDTSNIAVAVGTTTVIMDEPTGLANIGLDWIVNQVDDYTTPLIEAMLVDVIKNQLVNALQGLFGALTIDQEFEIPSPIEGGNANTLLIKTVPAGVDVSPERLQLRVKGMAAAKNPIVSYTHKGSLDYRGCMPASSLIFPPPAPIVVGLHDDLLNQLLFGVWEGGTLSMDLGPEQTAAFLGSFGLQNASLKVDALLPPVFDSCNRTGNIVQIGDLYLEVDAETGGSPTKIALWIQVEADIQINFATTAAGTQEASITLGDFNPFRIEVVRNEGLFGGDDAAIESLIKDVLIPQVLGSVLDSARFELPSFDLGEMAQGLFPTGTTIGIDIQQLIRDKAYLTIQGALK